MTYNFRVGLRARWQLELAGADVPLQDMLALLAAIETTGHIAGACRQCGMSYRHAWGLLRRLRVLCADLTCGRTFGYVRHGGAL